MENFMTVIGGIFLVIVTVFVASVFSGTVLWLIYPHIHEMFPTAAESGIIAKSLNWWDSVCITWIFTILFKTSSSSSSKSSK